MDTESGRVYLPEEFEARIEQRFPDDHQAEFERRLAGGKIVEVSDQVAIQQLLGQERAARKTRRKAQKQSRKRNRRK